MSPYTYDYNTVNQAAVHQSLSGLSTSAGDAALNLATLNAAITTVAKAGGGYIDIPAGTYSISGPINFTDVKYVCIRGAAQTGTMLNIAGTGHGVDMTGADHCALENLTINASGQNLAGIMLARSTVSDGGNCYFRYIQVTGFTVGIYSYGSELNSYWHVNSIVNTCGFFSNAGNPLNYTSTFTTVKTGGQSNTYTSWHHGQITQTGILDSGHDGALIIESATSFNLYNPIIGSRGLNVGNNVHLKGNVNQLAFFGVHFENTGARAIFVDNTGVNDLVVDNPVLAAGNSSTVFIGDDGVNNGNINGLHVSGGNQITGVGLSLYQAIGVVFGNGVTMTTNVRNRFSGIFYNHNENPTPALPADTQGILIHPQGFVKILGRLVVNGLVNVGGNTGPQWSAGNGAPAGGPPTGSLYSRLDGGNGTTLYVMRTSGWVAIA